MKVQTITTEEMRRNDAGEGLILQGCGGDLQEWVDGINDMLTESGILKNDTTFENVYKFEHDGWSVCFFPFRDVDLDMGRLAIWRLQTRETFGSMWLSDFVDNYLGGPLEEVHEGKIGEYVNITGSYEEREERNPMVEIRSAVHSNYVGMVAMLGADNRCILAGKRDIIIRKISRHIMITGMAPCVLSVLSRICIISFTGKDGRIPRKRCWSGGLP